MSVFQTLLVVSDIYTFGIICPMLYVSCSASTAGVKIRPFGP
jgi:hypothetical protein